MSAANQSLFAKTLFAFELAKRLEGTGVTSNAFYPGFVKSNLSRNAPWYLRAAAPLMNAWVKAECGIGVYLASAKEIERTNGVFCLKIREVSDTPLIMLSAKEEDIDKITGLTTGADDYMTKPFNPLELLARVKAQFRRQSLIGKADYNSLLLIKDLVIDKSKHSVKVKGIDIPVTPLEFAILVLLASHPGQVFSSEHIYETVWKEPFGNSDNTVMVHIRNLREKLDDDPRNPQYIKTVWGVGYKIE